MMDGDLIGNFVSEVLHFGAQELLHMVQGSKNRLLLARLLQDGADQNGDVFCVMGGLPLLLALKRCCLTASQTCCVLTPEIVVFRSS